MISVTNLMRNTVEKEKQAAPAQEFPDVKSDKVNLEVEKLNEQIIELTSKNSELTVCKELGSLGYTDYKSFLKIFTF